MKALVIHEQGVVNVEEVLEPSIADHDVKIKVKACGICGSDIPRVLNNKAHYYPIILGHEFSGVVAEVGSNVHNVKIGEHVVGVPLIPCHQCEDCVEGNYSLCKNYTFIGSRRSGAMAEYVVIPAQNVVKIDDSINFCDAAFIEPITVALHALKQNHHKPNKKVAILGMGTIGALTAQAVKKIGAENITIIVRNEKYNSLIEKIGACSIVDTSKSTWKDDINKITQGRGFDFVYESAGSVQTMHQAFQIAANKAHICFIGTPKENLCFTIQEWEQMNRKEFYLTGSWMSYSGAFPGTEWVDAVNLLRNGDIKIYPEMIHKKIKLSDSINVFFEYTDGKAIMGRNLLIME